MPECPFRSGSRRRGSQGKYAGGQTNDTHEGTADRRRHDSGEKGHKHQRQQVNRWMEVAAPDTAGVQRDVGSDTACQSKDSRDPQRLATIAAKASSTRQ